jgi:hypothetical protein
MNDQEQVKRKKWYQKGWLIALVIVVIIIGVLAVVGNAQKGKTKPKHCGYSKRYKDSKTKQTVY